MQSEEVAARRSHTEGEQIKEKKKKRRDREKAMYLSEDFRQENAPKMHPSTIGLGHMPYFHRAESATPHYPPRGENNGLKKVSHTGR